MKKTQSLWTKDFGSVSGQPNFIRRVCNGIGKAVNENIMKAGKFLMMYSFFSQVVKPDATLNSYKGIIFCCQLPDCSLEEIKCKIKFEQVRAS